MRSTENTCNHHEAPASGGFPHPEKLEGEEAAVSAEPKVNPRRELPYNGFFRGWRQVCPAEILDESLDFFLQGQRKMAAQKSLSN